MMQHADTGGTRPHTTARQGDEEPVGTEAMEQILDDRVVQGGSSEPTTVHHVHGAAPQIGVVRDEDVQAPVAPLVRTRGDEHHPVPLQPPSQTVEGTRGDEGIPRQFGAHRAVDAGPAFAMGEPGEMNASSTSHIVR